jgi:hypothetical protein
MDHSDLHQAVIDAGRTTRSQVLDQVVTGQSLQTALTTPDTLGLGGTAFGQQFFVDMFKRPEVQPPTPVVPREDATLAEGIQAHAPMTAATATHQAPTSASMYSPTA